MKSVSVTVLAVLLGCIAFPARADEQQWNCEPDGPKKLDMLTHAAAAGSALLWVESEVGSKGKAAAVLALAAAAPAVVKDFVSSLGTSVCVPRNPSNPGNNLIFIGHGPGFQNATDTAQRLKSTNIGNLNVDDKNSLTLNVERLLPLDEKFSARIKIDDFRSAGQHLSPSQAHRFTELFVSSQAEKLLRAPCVDKSHCSQ